jgi:hypothetical protein
MSAIDDGGPAFPHIDSGCGRFEEGMTLRDYFAAKAMTAYIAENYAAARDTDGDGSCPWSNSDVAEFSYIMADTMLAARKDQP